MADLKLPQPSGSRPTAEPARPDGVPAMLARLGDAGVPDDVRRDLVTQLTDVWYARGEDAGRARLDEIIIGLRRQNVVLFAVLLLSTLAVLVALFR